MPGCLQKKRKNLVREFKFRIFAYHLTKTSINLNY